MQKATIFTIALLLFFSTSAFAAATCGVNTPNSTGLEDCGIDADMDGDGTYERQFSSLQSFFNSLPADFSATTSFGFRIWVKNTNGVPVAEVSIECPIVQRTTLFGSTDQVTRSRLATPEQFALDPNTIGEIEMDYAFNLIKLEGATENFFQCRVYNEQRAIAFSASKNISVGESTKKISISVNPADVPRQDPPYNIGETANMKATITNKGTQEIVFSSVYASLAHGTPNRAQYYKPPCSFEGGVNAIPAGQSKVLNCSHTIEFLEGESEFLLIAREDVANNQVEVHVPYTVSGPAYVITRLSPFSLFDAMGQDLSIEYEILPEPGTSAMNLFFVAQVKNEGEEYSDVISEWSYLYDSANPERQQPLAGIDMESMLNPGKKSLRIMVFRNSVPEPLPDPKDAVGETGTFHQDLFSWAETSFSVPRMAQPDNQPYLPKENTFFLESGQEFTLGLRNLSNVSDCDAPDNVISYSLILVQGNPEDFGIQSITCNELPDGAVCPEASSTWPLLFSFSKTMDTEDFSDPLYGGEAPSLNAEIRINALERRNYEFELSAITNPACTTLDETILSENLGINMGGASIESIVATSTTVGEESQITLEISNVGLLLSPPIVKILDPANYEIADISPGTIQGTYILSYTPASQGNFKVKAEIKQPCEVCEKSTIFYAALPRASVPETNAVAIALTALGAVAIIAISKRRK